MHIHPSHVVSISLDRGLRISLQQEASDRAGFPLVPSLEAFRADTRAAFDAINLEGHQIVGSIVRAPKSGQSGPGRLCPGEKMPREFRRHLAMRLT